MVGALTTDWLKPGPCCALPAHGNSNGQIPAEDRWKGHQSRSWCGEYRGLLRESTKGPQWDNSGAMPLPEDRSTQPRLGPIAIQILSYLAAHPAAQDTVEGIAEWCLLEKRIRRPSTQVRRAVEQLQAEGLLAARTGTDGRARYRLNPRKRRTVALMLRSSIHF